MVLNFFPRLFSSSWSNKQNLPSIGMWAGKDQLVRRPCTCCVMTQSTGAISSDTITWTWGGFFWVRKFFVLQRTRKECPGKKLERNKAKPKQLLSSCTSSSSITAHQTMQASGYDFMKAFIKCPANHQLDSQDSHCIANCQTGTTSDQFPQSTPP